MPVLTHDETKAPLELGPNVVGRTARLVAILTAMVLMIPLTASATEECKEFRKQVSVDGGHTWFDADDPASAPSQVVGEGAIYRFIVTNCERNKKCFDTRITDADLDIDALTPGSPPGFLAPGEQITVTQDDEYFENLYQPDRCDTPGTKINKATETTRVEGGGTEMFMDEAYVNCEPLCGDGIVDPNLGETCDPPGDVPNTPPGNMNMCRDNCTYCGDGIVNNGEECDDPDDPRCTDDCMIIPPVCGDSIVDPDLGETCDPPGSVPDTPPGNMNACRDNCTYCGDGIVNNGEECDDPDDPNCSDDCELLPFCGDGIVDPDETCDPPGSTPDTPPGNENVCRDNCTYCGDGIVNNGEECDDPDDPRCSDDCMIIPPFCGDGIVDPDETCEPPGSTPDTPPGNENVCRDNCTYCGDGIVNNGEECDDPNDPLCTDTCELLCGLEVAKTCELPPPPAPPAGKCAGKLEQFTVIWNGDDRIDISIGDGLIGLDGGGSSGMETSVDPGDEVTFFTDGSTNDTIVNIFGLGESTFHLSCSDKDMDGDTTTNDDQQQVSPLGRDCGKDQGDGKGSSGINQWLLEGFVDKDGAVLDCTADPGNGATSCEFTPVDASCDTLGKPSNLTFEYTGGGCPGENDQGSKSDCSGSIDPSLPVTVTLDGGTLGTVNPGETFIVPTTGSNTTIELSNSGGTETNDVHTSCSAPLAADDEYGSLTLLALDGVGIGSDVVYAYRVSNGGMETVTNISVEDDQLGSIGSIASLAPGDSETLTATAFISMTTTNVASVDGDGPLGADCREDSNPVVVTVLPPPPCSASIAFKELKDDEIKYKLVNGGATTATLDSLVLNFPAALGAIKEVELNGKIFKSNDSSAFPNGVPSGMPIGPSDWTESDTDKRRLDPDKDKDLKIKFTTKSKNTSPGDFDGAVTFSEGCGGSL